jgi:putative ABC transport system permease protein
VRNVSRPSAGNDIRAKAERRFAWWLVWLYPPRFRRDVGLGLADAIQDRMEARRRAGASAAAVRLAACADTLHNAPLEWVAAIRSLRLERESVVRLKADATSDARGRSLMDKLSQDIRYALRLWRRRPGFAIVAILTLALGIGANTAMFSIVNAVLLRPLPYANSDRLVSVFGRTTAYPRGLISYDEYEALARQTGVDEPQRLVGSFVTGSFFEVLGLTAERGRLFSERESVPGNAQPVVVLSHDLWRQRFNEDPAAIGKTMTLNGLVLTVIGVLAPPFDAHAVPGEGYFIGGVNLFIPVGLYPAGPRGLRAAGPAMLGVARLKPGATVAAADSDLDVINKRLLAANPNGQSDRTLFSEPIQETVVGRSRTMLLLLLASVGVVLLIACVNVSHLLLARALDRQKEIALRAALGASQGMVARQLTVEAGILAVVSTAVGLTLGRWALSAIAWLQPPSVPIPDRVPLDGSVLLFTGGVAVLVAMLCSVAPALKSTRLDLGRVLAAGFRRASGAGRRTRDALMVAEMAMSVALVALSALLIQSLLAVQQMPIGFDASNVFTLQFRLPQTKYSKPEDIARFFKTAIERVRAIPGVESAALVRAVPFSGNGGTVAYLPEGLTIADPKAMPQARFHLVTPDYFRTLRIPVLKGRDFTDRDDLQAPLVAVVSDSFAKHAWPDQDPIGKRLTTVQTNGPITVIGVVGDTKHNTATEPPMPQLYAAHYQVPMIFNSLVARTAGDPMRITNDVRKAIWSVDKDQPVWTIMSLEQIVERTQGSSRFLALLLGIFAGVALLLAGVGIYGVTSYGVAQRTHEIGIRLALGASGDRVLGEVVSRGARLALIAVVIGLASAIALGQLASAVLFGVKPTDPGALAAAAIVLGAVSLAATYLPARRAAKVDPVVALAEE